jgi:tetratricopeptide (TPR) repeat protein
MMMRHPRVLLVLAVFLGGCFGKYTPSLEPIGHEPFFPGLGERTRPVTTGSPEAQRYFDQGLSFLYAFNHDEAVRSFQRATELDPDCAMAWWGISVANGPHINNPIVPPERGELAFDTWRAAHERAANANETEQALIEALGHRYADPPPDDRAALDKAYADAMRAVWQRFPNDADVGALFAEAMMDLRPWDLWTHDGQAQPGTEEIVSVLEAVMTLDPDHPLALHLYIHAVEASPHPEKATAAADRLRDLQPGLGHLVHMPSHIDVRTGEWEKCVIANTKAVRADRQYRDIRNRQGFYGLYIAHNYHMLAYGGMMVGRRAEAVRAMDDLIASMPPAWAKEYSAIADGYMAMPLEVRVRFGMWREVIAAPEFSDDFPFAQAMRHYARGVAHAAENHFQSARAEQRAFQLKKEKLPKDAFFGNNKSSDLLRVAENMLEGEISFREGRTEAGLQALRRAVAHEDALRYDEPPSWIQPARHALGASLLRAERWSEAEAVFREDLKRLPRNGWGLFGLAKALRAQGRNAEAAEVERQFKEVWAGSDITLTSPCFCQPRI